MDEIIYYPDSVTRTGPIQNIEGLSLMSSRFIDDQSIHSIVFDEFDTLGVKISGKLDFNMVTKELEKSFGDDVLPHPNRLGWFIFNWRNHFNRKMI